MASSSEAYEAPPKQTRPSEEESDIENFLNFESGMQEALTQVEQVVKPRIFRHTALKNFLQKTLAEMNPDLSVAGKSIDYFAETFVRYIFEKTVFDYWQVKNNHQDFEGWPEALKMDHFLECAWDMREFEQQLTFLYR